MPQSLPTGIVSSPEIERPMKEYGKDAVERINNEIATLIPTINDDFRKLCAYVMDPDNTDPEKASRTRSILAYVAGDTFGVERDQVDEFALSVELIHNSSLILDDLPSQDNSRTRRGKDAFWVKFGESDTHLTSIGMQQLAGGLVAKVDSENNLQSNLTRFVADSIGFNGMCRGQMKDLETFGTDPEGITIEKLDQIAHDKTSKAIALGVIGVAIICKVEPEVIEILEEYCYHTGIAYQVLDDVADATNTEEQTGKTVGLDAENGKPTYIDILGEKGAHAKAKSHADKALDAIERLPRKYNPRKLQEVVDMVSDR
ncbi:MAG TPA: polyprenyl synthetase family protein [Patescibacteria group bacterium]|nr:polyprenyl synthetase family protein [Patescibacteria group bacterium]